VNLFERLSKPILEVFPGLDTGDLMFGAPPNPDMGDVGVRMFEAAKKLRMAPPQIAQRVVGEAHFGPEVVEARAVGPFVNFRLERAVFARDIVAAIYADGERFGSNGSGDGRRALVEHTSINPNASPHVGRARNAMIGDSLVRLLRFEGYDVEVQYYVNDIGRQIALLVLACEDPGKMTFDDMLTTYGAANARAETDPQFAAQGYELLAQIEEGDPKAQQRFHAVTEMCLRGQLGVLERLGARYDVFVRESQYVRDPRLEAVLDALRGKDALFTDEEGRVTVDLSKLGYAYEEGRYAALLRSNGSSMYFYRDLAYTMDKLERNADLNLIVLGEDHKLYLQQLTLILEAAGKSAPEGVPYAHILLKEGKMSTRQGNVVLLSDFLDEATARASEKVGEQWPDVPRDEQNAIAEKVAVAAIRFAILRVNANKNVIFDWASALSFTGDTGPYIQYCCARINSILRKYGELEATIPDAFPVETDAEWALLMKLAEFPDTVAGATKQRSCAPIAQYALETARLFTAFYHDCPVLKAPEETQRVARALVCAATLQTLENALGILGINALERM